ncbi:MAG: hypothetical protein MUF25_19190, partial [Pirellulaceae bacterium]|nr:hypothetical protein [Pirellulaceae bacterium]
PAAGGDLLLELDVPELERELDQRQAAANKARAGRDSASLDPDDPASSQYDGESLARDGEE